MVKLQSSSNKLLNKIGNINIKKIEVSRAPINKIISTLLNVISLGSWAGLQKAKGYDELYHLKVIVILENGESYTIEKIPNITIKKGNPSFIKHEERLVIDINKKITLNQILDKCEQSMGVKFDIYDAFDNNCQSFILEFIRNTGYLSSSLRTFILQDVSDLVKKIPREAVEGVKLLTDIGAILQRFSSIFYKKGGAIKPLTYKNKFNIKYKFPIDEPHSKAEISKITGYKLSGLNKIFDKGIGAYKSNPESVRKVVKSPEQWAYGRIYSAVMGGKDAKIDKDLLIKI
jgi:hypothetical protein